jgi:hypothetical protein
VALYEWFKEIEEPGYPYTDDSGELRLKRIQSNTTSDGMSPIFQLFASVNVLFQKDFLSSFPVPNHHALKIVQNVIVPHYTEVKEIFIDGKLIEINVRFLKEESRKRLSDLLLSGIHPIVPDLYRNSEYDISPYPRKIKYYAVNGEKIQHKALDGMKGIRDFIKSSFLASNGVLTLMPSGWFLDDSLKESVTLQALSTFAENIILMVNENDHRIIGINIYG